MEKTNNLHEKFLRDWKKKSEKEKSGGECFIMNLGYDSSSEMSSFDWCEQFEEIQIDNSSESSQSSRDSFTDHSSQSKPNHNRRRRHRNRDAHN